MTWTAIIVTAIYGLLYGEIKVLTQVPMKDRAACEKFSTEFAAKSSKQVGVICISSETGETFATTGTK